MVMAATPFSPTYFSMVQLNIIVTMPVTRAAAISELPLEAALTRVRILHTGFTKWSRQSFLEKITRPATAVTEYPSPVAMAAPAIPISNMEMKT